MIQHEHTTYFHYAGTPLYWTSVRSVLLYGCKTWTVKKEDTQRIVISDRSMIRWICGVSFKDEMSSEELLKFLGI